MNKLIFDLRRRYHLRREQSRFQKEIDHVYKKKGSGFFQGRGGQLLAGLAVILFFVVLFSLLNSSLPDKEAMTERKAEKKVSPGRQQIQSPLHQKKRNAETTVTSVQKYDSAKEKIYKTPEKKPFSASGYPLREVTTPQSLLFSTPHELSEVIASVEPPSVIEEIKAKTGETTPAGWIKVRYGTRKIGWIKERNTSLLKNYKPLHTIFSEKIIHKKTFLQRVGDFLNRWEEATEALDIKKYAKLYDREFKAQGLSKTEWINRKKGIFTSARFIVLGVKKLKVLEEDEKFATIRFTQYYNNSDTLKTTVRKEMVLRIDKGTFTIYREKVL